VPIALITGRVFFGQRATPRQMLGMAVILAGVVVLLRGQP
jgi:multidrug transporter EmrE-like cation transporter